MPNPEFERSQYDSYGLRSSYRIVDSPTGERNVGHVSPQDAYDLGLSPENNAGINYMLSTFGNPELASHYNPDFENGVPSVELLSRYLIAVVEFTANGLDTIITKNALTWQELPPMKLHEVYDYLYKYYAKFDTTKQAFELFERQMRSHFNPSIESASGHIALGQTIAD